VTHQFDVSSVIQHQVLRLEIAVDDTLSMKILERFDDARDAEPRRHVVEMTSTNKLSNLHSFYFKSTLQSVLTL